MAGSSAFELQGIPIQLYPSQQRGEAWSCEDGLIYLAWIPFSPQFSDGAVTCCNRDGGLVHPAPERTTGEGRHSATGLGGFGGA